MLRPDIWIDYAKARGQMRRSDFEQLLNGVNVGGRVIVGGDQQAAAALRSVALANRSLGVILSLHEVRERKLDPHVTYTIDCTAVGQLLMMAKNETFHQTIDQSINLIQDLVVNKGEKIETALQVLREQADKVGHL